MIVSTELQDCMVNGYPSKKIVISYIKKDGSIGYFAYDIPRNDLYTWKYAEQGDVQDTKYVSWDKKPVCKIFPKNGKIGEQRIHEILVDLEKAYPRLSELHELNIPDIAFCDIEVDVDDSGFPEAETAKNQVNTISWVHKNDVIVFGLANLNKNQITDIQKRIDKHCEKFGNSYKFEYRYYPSEMEMLVDFMRGYVFPTPCVTGWNFMRYDWQYLYNRCTLLNIDISWLSPTNTWSKYSLLDMFNNGEKRRVPIPNHKLLFDYMEVYFKWDTSINPKESYKLDDVGNVAVGVKKVQHDMGFTEMWQKTPDDYVFYNAVDSILVCELDKKLKTANILYSLANLIHCDCIMAFSPVRSLQIVQCETMYKEGKVFPKEDKKIDDDADGGYTGAFVYEPIPGKYKNVIALDFASLYPTTMRQFNISPDTFIKKDKEYEPKSDEIKCVTGAVYKRNEEGMLPKILTSFYNQRKAYKKEMKVATQEMYDLEDIYERRFGKAVEL